ncbi:Lipocalin-like domain-containing protein [Flavobacterium longum]
MISRLTFLLLMLLLVACNGAVQPEDISKINGYWEIEKVILPDGNTKDYKINTTIDYFKIEGEKGFRKKVMPQVDGKYLDAGTSEKVSVSFQDGDAFLYYDSGYAKWKEKIISISDQELVFKNDNNLEYHYKKPVPFTIK